MTDRTSLAPLVDTAVAPSVYHDAATDPERTRIAEGTTDQAGRWWAFGPYVSERAWGTVREDYSADGRAPTASSSWRTPASSRTAGTGRSPPTTPRQRRTTSASACRSATRARRLRRCTCSRRSGFAIAGRGTGLSIDR